jgi:bacterioferritin-associated ferredoxin
MRIDRCVCMDRSFAEAVEVSRREGLSLSQIETRMGCGTGCGLCRPYLRRALRTGQTVFHEILQDQDEPPAR